MDEALKHWDRAAGVYSASRVDGPLATAAIYEPVVDALLGDVSGRRLLDAGCGDGQGARKLATRGARVTAIDGSREMLALAAAHPSVPGVEYQLADLTAPLAFPDGAFDVVLANMVLMDVPRIDVAIAEFARMLVRGGRFVFSITHPCFFTSDWVEEPPGVKRHKAVAGYLSPAVERLEFWGGTLHFHRPLSHYVAALARHGFVVDALEEPVPTEADVAARPEWRHHLCIPSFLLVRALRQ